MGKLSSIFLPTLVILSSAAANSSPLAPAAPPAPVAAAAAAAKANAPTPSRYASMDLKAYVEALAKQLAMCDRATDPFGQLQDPNAKPVIKPTATKAPRRFTPEPPASLSDIVGRIEITTIMPRDKRFLVGSRSFGQGDRIPLNFRNKQIHTEVTEVNSRKIVFRNVDTGELGVRLLNLLPQGMTPGTRNLGTPGMVPASPNSALEIEAAPPSAATTTVP